MTFGEYVADKEYLDGGYYRHEKTWNASRRAFAEELIAEVEIAFDERIANPLHDNETTEHLAGRHFEAKLMKKRLVALIRKNGGLDG